VLDTVLWTASLLRGFELLHASSVCTSAGVVAVVAPQGFGKTTLALELIRRGYPLFADDILALGRAEDGLVCHPGPPLMNIPRQHAGDRHGRPLAILGAQTWVELERVEERPSPAAAVFVLEPGRPGSTPVQPSQLRLLPHSLGFRHLPGRQRTRFEVFGELAATTPVFALGGAMQVPASTLADGVERSLERVASRGMLASVAG
jgi:hypothetical protein